MTKELGRTRHTTLGTGVKLSEREAVFLEGLRRGLPPAAAAARAGYASPTATARALMLRPHIRDQVAMLQAELQQAAGVSVLDVLGMLNEAYEMARDVTEDPNAMVRVAAEINKMMGFYADKAGGDSAKDRIVGHLEKALNPDEVSQMTDEELESLLEEEDNLGST